jgi:hypothetical protein
MPRRSFTKATQGIPVPGGENARINLWLFRGRGPTDDHEVAVIVKRFEFVPRAESTESGETTSETQPLAKANTPARTFPREILRLKAPWPRTWASGCLSVLTNPAAPCPPASRGEWEQKVVAAGRISHFSARTREFLGPVRHLYILSDVDQRAFCSARTQTMSHFRTQHKTPIELPKQSRGWSVRRLRLYRTTAYDDWVRC